MVDALVDVLHSVGFFSFLLSFFLFFLIFCQMYSGVFFTKNSGYRSLKNRSCVTVFGSCGVTLTVGEPLGDVSGSANHNFRTSVTGISGEIDASNIILYR